MISIRRLPFSKKTSHLCLKVALNSQKFNQTRLLSSVDATGVTSATPIPPTTSSVNPLLNRCIITAEVIISKIFPGGFAWQYFSGLAGQMGYSSTSVGFAAMTGLGDFTGVFIGSAAFCSGAAWQPFVNLFQSTGLPIVTIYWNWNRNYVILKPTGMPFVGVAAGTWVGCGLAFFTGLRLFRTVMSPVMAIAPNSATNLEKDAALSVSIGGATGAFVGTDVVYLNGEGNFLKDIIGVQASDTVLTGCVKAGASTSLGLGASQMLQNVAYAQGRNWTDP
ncbi:unnamed protein product [Sphagnum jensenii]|uniref:Uncharacterized protein n=1 Tax=Sphagnum jensenii TaxID=128206 RepID=A0ABP0VH39_9BRYO